MSIGEGIDVEMYLESPAHLLTYKGEEMTDVVEQSSIREDLGKYDFMALMCYLIHTINLGSNSLTIRLADSPLIAERIVKA